MTNVLTKLRAKVLGNSAAKEVEIAIALEDYTPTPGSGLAFRKGDRFIVKSKAADTNWWHVKREDNHNIDGFAPSNFLIKECDLENVKWISFNMNRDRAISILRRAEEGSFLIRSNDAHMNSNNLSLSLSVRVHNQETPVVHFQIHKVGSCFRIGQSFESIPQLVKHYAGRRKDPTIVLTYSMKKQESVVPWEYEEAEIEMGLSLDRGFFGQVFTGILNGEEVAIKSPDQSRMDPVDYLKEADIARLCKHPNVLETIGICRSRYFIITEYMANKSLKKYFRKHVFTAADCLSVAYKIASAMEYLHSRNIVHRDLAARNVLVGESIAVIKVCDFGLARSVESSQYYYTNKEIFPLRWTAPEGFVKFDGILNTQRGKITSAADVWSYAVVLWELYTNGMEPYGNISDGDLHKMLTVENKRLPKPDKCPDDVYAMMRKCWSIERKDRPAFTALLSFLGSQMAVPPSPPPAPASLSPSSTTDDNDSIIVDTGAYNEMPAEEEHVAPAEDDDEPIRTMAKVSIEEEKPALVNSPSSSEGSTDGPPARPTALF